MPPEGPRRGSCPWADQDLFLGVAGVVRFGATNLFEEANVVSSVELAVGASGPDVHRGFGVGVEEVGVAVAVEELTGGVEGFGAADCGGNLDFAIVGAFDPRVEFRRWVVGGGVGIRGELVVLRAEAGGVAGGFFFLWWIARSHGGLRGSGEGDGCGFLGTKYEENRGEGDDEDDGDGELFHRLSG